MFETGWFRDLEKLLIWTVFWLFIMVFSCIGLVLITAPLWMEG